MALFQSSDESSSESEDENPKKDNNKSPLNDSIHIEKVEEAPIIWEKIITVMDLVPDDDEFGAALPPHMAASTSNGQEKTINLEGILQINKD